jgi:hypothetical protein
MLDHELALTAPPVQDYSGSIRLGVLARVDGWTKGDWHSGVFDAANRTCRNPGCRNRVIAVPERFFVNDVAASQVTA